MKPYLVLKVTLDTLEVVMSVDVSIEIEPRVGCVGAEMALVHNTILIWGQTELVFSIILTLDIAIDGIAIGNNTGSLGLRFSVVEDSIVQSLK